MTKYLQVQKEKEEPWPIRIGSISVSILLIKELELDSVNTSANKWDSGPQMVTQKMASGNNEITNRENTKFDN